MDTPLQFLRNWLPPEGAPGNNTHPAETLRQWVAALDDAAPADVAAALSSRLMPLVSEQRNMHMRTRLLDAFEEAADKVLPTLEDEVKRAPLPLAPQVKALALTADNLLKAQIKGCRSIVSNIEGLQPGALPNHLLQHVVLRAMYALQRRQMLAYSAYAPPSDSSWQQLHELHRLARSRGVSKVSKNSLSIEHIYVVTLLLAYADPSKFPRTELDALRTCADRMAPLVALLDTDDALGTEAPSHLFLVRGNDGQPGAPFRRSPKVAEARNCLVVDCGAVVAALNEEIALRADPAPGRETMLPQVGEPMLRVLLKAWGSQPVRRFSRMRFKPRVDLVSSLPDAMKMVTGEALRRRREDHNGRNGQQEHSAPPISEWAVINESPDGFGIRYIEGPMRRLEVGELVGLRSREHSRTHLCLIRRASNAGQNRFDIGLQDLSPQAEIIDLPPSGNGQQRQALLLPELPAYAGAAGIIAMPGDLPADLELTHQRAQKPVRLRLGRPIERNARLEFYLLEEVS